MALFIPMKCIESYLLFVLTFKTIKQDIKNTQLACNIHFYLNNDIFSKNVLLVCIRKMLFSLTLYSLSVEHNNFIMFKLQLSSFIVYKTKSLVLMFLRHVSGI